MRVSLGRMIAVLALALAGVLMGCRVIPAPRVATPRPSGAPHVSPVLWPTVASAPGPTMVEPVPSQLGEPTRRPSEVKLTILYDNYSYDDRLQTAWGFSCLVERGDLTLLFDTGGNAPTLLANMEALGCNPEQIDTVVLSHEHGDHVGGLEGILAANDHVIVYVPQSFSKGLKERVTAGAQMIEGGEPVAIAEGILTTGEMGTAIPEQALIITTSRGPLVITGCAHPGIVSTVIKAHDLLDRDIYLVMGGFHLGAASRSEIEGIAASFRDLGVEKVVPCHCTGDLARSIFEAAYGDDCTLAGVGWSWQE